MIYRYPHSEKLRGLPLADIDASDGPLVLWGAGKVGGMAAHCLGRRGIAFDAFCDASPEKIGTSFCGHPVISPAHLRDALPGATVLVSSSFHRNIVRELRAMGWREDAIRTCVPLFLEIDFEGYDFWMEPAFAVRTIEDYMQTLAFYGTDDATIDQLCIPITQRCTLRCRNCSSYVPYVAHPVDDDLDVLLDDLRRLWDAAGSIRCLNILGGEPLMHRDLPRFLSMLCTDRRFDKIAIITNGTLLPSPALMAALRADDRCTVRLSDYGATSTRIVELRALLEGAGIPYENVNYAYWNELPHIAPRDATPDELRETFEHCTASAQLSLHAGRLFCCTPMAQLWDFAVLPHAPTDTVDIRAPRPAAALARDIARFLQSMREGQPLHACRYCSGNHTMHFERKVPVAEQTRERLTFPDVRGGAI